jgi:hypothetical protein
MSYYPYCIHGVYVGGCGVDYMCGACEDGYTGPTLRECREYARRIYVDVARRCALGHFAGSERARLVVSGIYWEEAARKLAANAREMREIARWATDEDDREWIYRRWESEAAAHADQSDEDQFAALPAHVLDGAW